MRKATSTTILATTVTLLMGSAVQAQGVQVAIVPGSQTVAPGSQFVLDLQVIQSGSPFNGFDAIVSYDPAALTFMPLSPLSQQQGSYITTSCGNTFHRFTPAADSLSITSVLLCAGVSLPGPGQIYKLKFQASTTPQTTWVRLRRVQFYNAGLFVNPAFTSDAAIGIGTPVDIGPPAATTGGLSLRASPNPFRGQTQFQIDTPTPGSQRLTILDIQGRTVRHLGDDDVAVGVRTVVWDGRDDAGRTLPPGVYRASLASAREATSTRIALIR